MARQPVYFAAAHQKGRADVAAGAELVNLYAQQNPQGAKAPLVLIGTPGSKLFADLDTTPVRGVFPWRGKLYAVTNTGFYEVTGPGEATKLADVALTGPASWAENGQVLVFVDGSRGYRFDGETLEEIRDSAFYPSETVTFLDGYFIFSRSGKTGQFFISRLYSTDFDALDFATAEANPDGLVGVLADHRELWMFGEKTVEVWWNAGGGDFPFERINGAVIEHGCASPWCFAKANNTVYWLSEEGIVYHAPGGYQPQRISTHDVEHDLTKRTLGRSYAFTYVDEGHWFYQITVDDVTWVYDVATGLWHKRRHYDHGRHHASCYASAFNRHIIGDFSTGKLYEWSLDAHHDNGRPLVAEAVSAPIHRQRERARHRSFEVDFDAGVGLSGDGAVTGGLPGETPDSAAGRDPTDPNAVRLLLHFEGQDGATGTGAFVDSSPYARVPSFDAGNVTIKTAVKALGASSGYFDNLVSFDGLQYNDLDTKAELRPGDKEFTFDVRARFDSLSANRTIFATRDSSTVNSYHLRVLTDGSVQFLGWGVEGNVGGTSIGDNPDALVITLQSGPGAVAAGQWYAFAVDRVDDDWRLYVDGVVVDSRLAFPATLYTGAVDIAHFKVGLYENLSEPMQGYVDELRIVIGEGLYGGPYTPATLGFGTDPAATAGLPGDDPQIVLQFSDDKGRTWSNERWKPMGKEGRYLERAIWYRLGQSRDRRYRIRISDPVPRRLLATAYVEAVP